jgi:GT2 family glycosyltransferase
MRYALATQELTAPLGPIGLQPDDSGLGLLLRRQGRPVAFIMKRLPPSTTLLPGEVDELITRSAAYELLADTLRNELVPLLPSSGSELPTVTVAVCTRGREELLEACLQSVLQLRHGLDDISLHVMVVDNAPPNDRTHRVVQSHSGIRYVSEPRPGLDFARNRALLESQTDFVAFLDDDVEVDEGWLAGLIEVLEENPDARAITGQVLPHELRSQAQVRFESRGGFRRGFFKRRYRGPQLPGNPLYPVGSGMFGAGCNMVLHRRTTLQLDGFDEALDTGSPLPGGGDLDIFYRMIRAGHPLVYEPKMLAFHKHRPEHRQLRHQYWTWGTGLMAYVQKTYNSDPDARPQLRALRRWWLWNQMRLLRRSLKRNEAMSPELVLAELAGGCVGMTGAYSRSRRRVQRLRAE